MGGNYDLQYNGKIIVLWKAPNCSVRYMGRMGQIRKEYYTW